MRKLTFLVFLLIPCLFINVSYSIEPVTVEFLYYKPCTCNQEEYNEYIHNKLVVDNIENDYGTKLIVERIGFYSAEGIEKIGQYGLESGDWNAIVINYERVFTGYLNETYVKEILNAYLNESIHDIAITKVKPSKSTVEVGEKININITLKNFGIETESFNVSTYCNEFLIGTQQVDNLSPSYESSLTFVWDTTNQTFGKYIIKAEAENVVNETNLENNIYIYDEIEVTPSLSNTIALFILAFSFGFFETFSPCLIILLSFILSYTISKTTSFKESFSKVMLFGGGFLSATLILAVTLGLVLLSSPMIQYSLTWIVCIFTLVFGLNLLGVLKIPSKTSLQSKPIIQKLAKKYVVTYAGLFLLGFIFYFLDPCIAPIFVSMMPLLLPEKLLSAITIFSIGAIIPFVGIGILAGTISKLVRITYKHRFKVRAISGFILVAYALYLIVTYLLPANPTISLG